jgi:hypothetical protein
VGGARTQFLECRTCRSLYVFSTLNCTTIYGWMSRRIALAAGVHDWCVAATVGPSHQPNVLGRAAVRSLAIGFSVCIPIVTCASGGNRNRGYGAEASGSVAPTTAKRTGKGGSASMSALLRRASTPRCTRPKSQQYGHLRSAFRHNFPQYGIFPYDSPLMAPRLNCICCFGGQEDRDER